MIELTDKNFENLIHLNSSLIPNSNPFSQEESPITFALLNMLSSLAENHPDTFLILSSSGKVIIQNKETFPILGEEINEIQDFESIAKKSYRTIHTAFLHAVSGNTQRYEIEVTNYKYGTLHVLFTFIPLIYEEKVEAVYLVMSDMTDQVKLKDTLLSSQKHLNNAQQIADIGSFEYWIAEDRLKCSKHFFKLFGLPQTPSMKMEEPFKLVHPDDYRLIYDQVQKAIRGKDYTTEFRIYHGLTGNLRYIKVKAVVLWKNGKPYKLNGVIKDETAEKLLESELKDTIARYAFIFDNLTAGIWMRDAETGKMIFASKGMEDILKIPLETLYTDKDIWRNMVHPCHHHEIGPYLEKSAKGESAKFTYRLIDGTGDVKWLFEQTIPTTNEKGDATILFGFVTDITHEKFLEEKINHLARYDALTNLPNQHSIYEVMESLCNRKHPFALLYLDIDRLNIINDSLGYHIGDEALKTLANRFSKLMPPNSYFGRLNSNDFIVLLWKIQDKEEVYSLAEMLITVSRKPLTIQEFEMHLSTSIGISLYGIDGTDKQTLLENAHSALYHAKRQGKANYQVYSYTDSIHSYKKYNLDQDMRKAINNEEFEIFYQPQVEPISGAIYGAEALLRWNHPEWGYVSPGEFIPLAEENHLINAITDWVIEKVCAQLKNWKDEGIDLKPIAINISPTRFMKKGLAEYVKTLLSQYDISATFIELEITESTLLQNEKNVLFSLQQLRDLGIKIAIDDFGTGYSSLMSIRTFKPDIIKIDQIFTRHITSESSVDKGIILSIIHLAKELGMTVVAEGVEEYEQLQFLLHNGCHYIQGYLFSKPLQKKDFYQILKTGSLSPSSAYKLTIIDQERRAFIRFQLPTYVQAVMTLIEMQNEKVEVGTNKILIENISFGGMKIISSMNLAIQPQMKYQFCFSLLNKKFILNGVLKWQNELKGSLFAYGVAFLLEEEDETSLASTIHLLNKLNESSKQIPDTDFIFTSPEEFFSIYK